MMAVGRRPFGLSRRAVFGHASHSKSAAPCGRKAVSHVDGLLPRVLCAIFCLFVSCPLSFVSGQRRRDEEQEETEGGREVAKLRFYAQRGESTGRLSLGGGVGRGRSPSDKDDRCVVVV